MSIKKIRGSPDIPMSHPSRLDKKSSQMPLGTFLRRSGKVMSKKVNPRGKTKRELKRIFRRLIIRLAIDIEPYIRTAALFIAAAVLALLAKWLSFEHDPMSEASSIGVSGFLALWFILEVVEIKTGIPIKKEIKSIILKLIGKK